MKLSIEVPMSVVSEGYDRDITTNKYDADGAYMGVVTVRHSYIPIWIKSKEKGKYYYQDELNKMTKAQLLDYIRDNYSINRYEMEVVA